MMKFALGAALLLSLVAACGDDGPKVLLPDAVVVQGCSPTAQTGCAPGEKCTWFIDAVTPQPTGPVKVFGHTGCAPDGTVQAGGDCKYGAPGETGFDNCVKGTVCSDFRQDNMEPNAVCKTICDAQAKTSGCGSDQYCFNYVSLFSTGDTTPASGGICEQACDPLKDNDFDGSGSFPRMGSNCGSDLRIGCYGKISGGSGETPTQFACIRDRHWDIQQPVGLRHRVLCTSDNGCAEPGKDPFTNSCNQGYQPLLKESTMVSTAVCTALCKPYNCYLNNCGSVDENRIGIFPDRCAPNDRIGEFFNDQAQPHPNGEHCRYLWRSELGSGGLLESKYSDAVGMCFDHTKYLYDKDGDGTAEAPFPPCSTLPLGFGSGSSQSDPNYWGAADLGCTDSMKAGLQTATGKQLLMRSLEKQRAADMPRLPYGGLSF